MHRYVISTFLGWHALFNRHAVRCLSISFLRKNGGNMTSAVYLFSVVICLNQDLIALYASWNVI